MKKKNQLNLGIQNMRLGEGLISFTRWRGVVLFRMCERGGLYNFSITEQNFPTITVLNGY